MTDPIEERFNEENATILDPCPSCGEETKGYYLGSAENDDDVLVAGWMCGECETVVEEDIRTGEMIEVEGGEDRD